MARLVIRWGLFKRFYVDDYLLTLSALCLIADLVIQHYMFNLGGLNGGLPRAHDARTDCNSLTGMSDMSNSTKDETVAMMKVSDRRQRSIDAGGIANTVDRR